MTSRERSIGFASLLAAGLVFRLASLPAAQAQAVTPAGDPAAPAPTDPNAPPPGGYPPPAGAPSQYTPAVQQPAPPPVHNSYVAMPFLGLNTIQNDNSGTGPGLRVGGIAGARLNDQVSVNAELVYDLINISNAPSGTSAYNFQLALAPFFHAQIAPTAEIIVGPKVGFFHEATSESGYGYSGGFSTTGWLVGANVGGFVRVSNLLQVGGLVSFDYEKESTCSTSGGYGTCMTDNTPGLKLLSLAAAVMF